MKKEAFTKALLDLLAGCSQKAAENWIEYAAYCVEREQFVDFTPKENAAEAVEDWLDCIFAALYQVKENHGSDVTTQICDLAANGIPLYPYEMAAAAEHFSAGGAANEISELIDGGKLDGDPPFFLKLVDVLPADSPYREPDPREESTSEAPFLCQY